MAKLRDDLIFYPEILAALNTDNDGLVELLRSGQLPRPATLQGHPEMAPRLVCWTPEDIVLCRARRTN